MYPRYRTKQVRETPPTMYYVKCRRCNHIWSKTEDETIGTKMTQWIKEPPLTTCEKCGAKSSYGVYTQSGIFRHR